MRLFPSRLLVQWAFVCLTLTATAQPKAAGSRQVAPAAAKSKAAGTRPNIVLF